MPTISGNSEVMNNTVTHFHTKKSQLQRITEAYIEKRRTVLTVTSKPHHYPQRMGCLRLKHPQFDVTASASAKEEVLHKANFHTNTHIQHINALRTQRWTVGFHTVCGISWLTEWMNEWMNDNLLDTQGP
jgi:hypothetical protein